jgi:hypothetical protein
LGGNGAYQFLYFGLPWPGQLSTWLHVLGWPAFVVLGLLRWIFMPFAVLAFLGFLAVVLLRRRRRS